MCRTLGGVVSCGCAKYAAPQTAGVRPGAAVAERERRVLPGSSSSLAVGPEPAGPHLMSRESGIAEEPRVEQLSGGGSARLTQGPVEGVGGIRGTAFMVFLSGGVAESRCCGMAADK